MEQLENPTLELEIIHYQRLHIARRAFTIHPIESLYIEANEPPLYLGRYKLTLQYYTKLISWLQNPVITASWK